MTHNSPLPLGIAAGVYKTANDCPVELLDTTSSVTFGSFTSTYNEGNRKLPVTELFDENRLNSLNAKGLPNDGLPAFWENELPSLIKMFASKQARLRVSISPRESGELGQTRAFLTENNRWKQVDEIEVNLACPNHRTGEEGLHPVLARDPQAVNDRLKEWSGYPGKWSVKIAPDTPEPELFQLVQILMAFKPNAIVSANTRLNENDEPLAGQRMSVQKGGFGGAQLLEAGVEQMKLLRRMVPQTSDIRLIACGGITDAASAEAYRQAGADEGQMATIPYFQGPKAVQQIIQDQYLTD